MMKKIQEVFGITAWNSERNNPKGILQNRWQNQVRLLLSGWLCNLVKAGKMYTKLQK